MFELWHESQKLHRPSLFMLVTYRRLGERERRTSRRTLNPREREEMIKGKSLRTEYDGEMVDRAEEPHIKARERQMREK